MSVEGHMLMARYACDRRVIATCQVSSLQQEPCKSQHLSSTYYWYNSLIYDHFVEIFSHFHFARTYFTSLGLGIMSCMV